MSNKGLTLVELLLAAAIMAFAVAGMLGVFSSCIVLNAVNKDLTIASSHAQYVLEGMRNANFSALPAAIDAGLWDYTSSAINATGLTALRDETISTVRGAATNPLDVNVTVNWTDRINRAKTVFFETLIEG